MTYHAYDPETFVLIGPVQGQEDPLASELAGEPVLLQPAHSTEIEPPQTSDQQQAVFDEASQTWRVQEIEAIDEIKPFAVIDTDTRELVAIDAMPSSFTAPHYWPEVPVGDLADNHVWQLDVEDTWVQVLDYRGEIAWLDFETSMEITKLGPLPDGAQLERPDPPEPEPLSLDELKARAIQGVIGLADSLTEELTRGYPEAETKAWTQKLLEAKTLLEAVSAEAELVSVLSDLPILASLKQQAGFSDEQLVAKAKAIIAKGQLFATISAVVEVMREQAQTAIAAVTSEAELDLVSAEFKQAALAKAAELGLTPPQ